MLLHLGLENHHWIQRFIANSAKLCLSMGILERKLLIVMQTVRHWKKVQGQAQIKNFFHSKTKSKTDNSKNDCLIYDNNDSEGMVQR